MLQLFLRQIRLLAVPQLTQMDADIEVVIRSDFHPIQASLQHQRLHTGVADKWCTTSTPINIFHFAADWDAFVLIAPSGLCGGRGRLLSTETRNTKR